jgi:hypothetical protein
MNNEIISDKLLVLGGSHKNDENATGGFGKAKEVLFFAWNYWEILSCPTSKDLYYVDSEMIGKEPIRHQKGNFTRGTIIKIKYDSKEYEAFWWKQNIKAFVRTCTTKCKIFLNDRELERLDARGKKYEYDIATLRINKSKPQDSMYIRINGITMFTWYMSVDIPATVTIDLKGKSIDLLASSRESIKSDYQRAFNKIVEGILTNPKSLVEKDDKIYIDKYIKREIEEFREVIVSEYNYEPELIQAVNVAVEACMSGEKSLIESTIEDIKDIDPEVAERLRMVVNGCYTSELGYSYVVHRYQNKNPAIDPTSPKAQVILHNWKLVVDELTKMYYPNLNYVVGFDFDPAVNASYTKGANAGSGIGTSDHICVNPTKIKQYSDALALGHWIFPKACHELAHVEIDNHNEYFCSTWAKFMESMGDNPRKWVNIFNQAKHEVSRINKNRK